MIRIDRSLEEATSEGLTATIGPQFSKTYRPHYPFVTISAYHPQTGCLSFVVDSTDSSEFNGALDKIHWIYGNRDHKAEHYEWFTETLAGLGNRDYGLTLFYDEGEYVVQYGYPDKFAGHEDYLEGRSNLGFESALDYLVTCVQGLGVV